MTKQDMGKRDTTISICKALGIILMVITHSGSPGKLCAFAYEFHMPLFFITAGYFFSLRYLNDEATFIKKRIKGLYIPFIKWSVIFLIIHNSAFSMKSSETLAVVSPTLTLGIRYNKTCGT